MLIRSWLDAKLIYIAFVACLPFLQTVSGVQLRVLVDDAMMLGTEKQAIAI
jgi:hypothetical protein